MALKVFFLLLCAVLVHHVSARTPWHRLEAEKYDFSAFLREFGKRYAGSEFAARKAIFEQNLQKIVQHNRGHSSWKMGVNHMADWTAVEFARLRGRVPTPGLKTPSPPHVSVEASQMPAQVDWREKGAVTPVKDQGQCGSCWTFASTETMESHNFLKHNVMVELSEQQVASCSINPHDCGGSGGCEGGIAELAFASVRTAGGIASEWTYPYVSHDGTDFKCKFDQNKSGSAVAPAAQVSDYIKLRPNNYQDLMQAVANVGPVAISVAAEAWHLYETGVFSGCNTSAPVVDHVVQLVGYGTDNGMDYWLVRNSWTPTWGERGYIRLHRYDSDASRPCGIDPQPGQGSGCNPQKPNVTVCGMCGILSDSSYPIMA